jgi:hypothetical protein
VALSLQPEEWARLEAVFVPGDELFRGGSRSGDSSPGRGSAFGMPPDRVGGEPEEETSGTRNVVCRK